MRELTKGSVVEVTGAGFVGEGLVVQDIAIVADCVDGDGAD